MIVAGPQANSALKFKYGFFEFSWWTEGRTCWCSTTTAPPSRCCSRWWALNGSALMRTELWPTTTRWWSCWRPAPRARMSTLSWNATLFYHLKTFATSSQTSTVYQRWRLDLCFEETRIRPLWYSHIIYILSTVISLLGILFLYSPGESGLRELCESLLCGHRGRNEGDLHLQSYLEALWQLPGGHVQCKAPSDVKVTRVCLLLF